MHTSVVLQQEVGSRLRFFKLVSLSFGAADNYAQNAGQLIFADNSSDELALRGARAIGAFVIGKKSLRIRAAISAHEACGNFAFVRATTETGEMRIKETPLAFEDGVTEIDLQVIGIDTTAVATIDENWIWECRPEGGEFAPIESRSIPVRLYFTAGIPLNSCPRESFYHVACASSGATDALTAEQNVWQNFTASRDGRFLTNARNQRLGFWREQKPGAAKTNFIDRDAQHLVTMTDSSCRGWAELFREALAIHGVSSTVRAVQPKLSAVHPRLGLPTFQVPNGRGGKTVVRTIGILVKPFKWKRSGQLAPFPFATEQCEVAPGKFLWKIDNPVDPFTARWPQTDAEDLMRSAQTCPDEDATVRGIFGNHAVVLVERNGKQTWYDPSFGIGPHDSLLSYENDLLGRGEENHGGLFAIIGWKRELKLNPLTGQMEEHNAGLLLGAAPPPATPVLEACDPG
jgi:hypothetical protein